MDVHLDVAVEIFVGIQLRRVGGNEEQLDLIFVRLGPGLHFLPMMDAEIIRDQIHPLLATLNKPPKKQNLFKLCHPCRVGHESHLALVGHRRDVIEFHSSRILPNHRRGAFLRVAPTAVDLVGHFSLVGPEDGRLFLLSPLLDLRILLLAPPLHGCRVLLIGFRIGFCAVMPQFLR